MRSTLVLSLAAGLTIAACGGDDEPSGEASTGPTVTTTAPGSTAAPVVTAAPGSNPPGTAAATAAPSSNPPGTAAATAAPSSNPPGTAAATGAPGSADTAGSVAPSTAQSTDSAALAPDPAVSLTEVASVDAPTDLAWRDGDEGLYVVEQGGRIVRLGGGDPTTVLDVSELTDAGGERGLLGLAFAPSGDIAYINYTDNDGNTVVAEYPVDADGTFRTGDEARTVLQIEQPFVNHNGGGLKFGPDGYLYIGMGDGGDGGDPERRASAPSELLGKMLRIDPAIGGGQPYTVPADNPFVGTDGAAPEIWATGLRNPWRFSFDRDTGDLWIADVGQNEFEEVDVAPATGGLEAGRGLFFGWSAFEGEARFNEDVSPDGHTPPIFTYAHDEGCSISGGARARGGLVATLEGWYVFADYCAGTVWALEVLGAGSELSAGRRVTLAEVDAPTAVVDGPDGALYVLSGAGPVLRLDPP